ncbi:MULTISPECIES: sensor histidine kinase [Rickettsieae]|uniref:sensor histidine kinase n=1 Tax=Rickettsieae TaxID=33988 RepID=UPI000B9A4EB2|nr:HAMP domain-containing sensor histidine kinase [Rickettsia endosymbiont of Culicoides newsteadi]OZG31572.1 osmolarity sensor protein ENVZ (envZ) [Rickettsia endosymbiont of Culicoides newsteadi]
MLSIHKIIPQTLLARFVLIIIVPTLIGQILAVFLFYDRHWYNVSYYTSNIIANEIISLLEKDDNNLLEKNTIATNYLNLSYQFYPKLTLPSTQPRISEELEIFKNIINVKINKNNIVKLNDSGRIEVLLQLTDGLIQITFPAKLLMNPTAYIFVLWLIFLTILLLSVSLIFSKNQIKSILILADAADQFGQGITKLQTFKPSGAKEIRKAGIAFLKMKERIEKQISKRTRMLAMISHDLCTPLTRMKLQLELMNKSEETEGLREDIVAMEQMIKSYLDFARGENGEEAQIIELSSWMLNVTNKWSANIELITIGQPVYTQIKPSNFERAISNVINNAIKYSTKIKITICSTSTNVIIKIEDNGIGIKDEEKLLVFKAFYRSDKSRSLNNSGNVGLGLAITKEIIIDHSGTISLQDSKALGGLLVEISLPIANPRKF